MNLHHNMQDTHVHVQYHTFLLKCIKNNEMKKVALKIDKICIFLGQLTKYMIILSLHSCLFHSSYTYIQDGPKFMIQTLKVSTGHCNNHL